MSIGVFNVWWIFVFDDCCCVCLLLVVDMCFAVCSIVRTLMSFIMSSSYSKPTLTFRFRSSLLLDVLAYIGSMWIKVLQVILAVASIQFDLIWFDLIWASSSFLSSHSQRSGPFLQYHLFHMIPSPLTTLWGSNGPRIAISAALVLCSVDQNA